MARLIFVLLIMTTSAVAGDPWTFFYPEKVTSMQCVATTISFDLGVRDKDGHEIFVDRYKAEASAVREGMPEDMAHWSKTLGMWEVNDKGRDSAIDACKVWIKMAAKKVRIAHGGTK